MTKEPQADYYQMVRLSDGNRKYVIDNLGPIKVRPKDKKDYYVKRCVAVAGDSLTIKD